MWIQVSQKYICVQASKMQISFKVKMPLNNLYVPALNDRGILFCLVHLSVVNFNLCQLLEL